MGEEIDLMNKTTTAKGFALEGRNCKVHRYFFD